MSQIGNLARLDQLELCAQWVLCCDAEGQREEASNLADFGKVGRKVVDERNWRDYTFTLYVDESLQVGKPASLVGSLHFDRAAINLVW